MKKVAFITVLLFVCLAYTSAQNTETNQALRKNAVFLDLGGPGLWLSPNYEHRMQIKLNQRIAYGVGLSYIPSYDFIITGSVNYLLGNKNNFEVGLSPAYLAANNIFYVTPRIGYRYERSSGFLFRIGFSPIIGAFPDDESDSFFRPLIYFSFGYTF